MGDTFPISGSIDPRSFPFLLTNLHRNGATGSLKVEGPSYQKAIYFRAGRILFGSSNDPRDQLGAILIENGKITPEQLEDVNSKVGPGNPLAKVLAETGFVSQRELSEAARAKVERILSDVMAYTSGTFEFEDGVLPKGAVDLKLASGALVVSAVRALTDRNFVLRHLEGLGAVLAAPREAPPAAADLPPEAKALLEQFDGRTTLKDAAARSRLEEFEVAKVACALLFLGLVERRELTGVSPRDPEPAFHLDSGSELDLAETARAALAIEPPAAVDNPFFVSAAPEPPAGFDSLELPPAPPVPPTPSAPTPAQPVQVSEEPELAIAQTPPPRPLPLVPPPPRHPAQPETPEPPAPAPPTASAPQAPMPSFPSPFDRPGPAAQSAKRPSKDELAALDALLDSRPAEGPLESLGKRPEPEWAPRFGQAAGRTGRTSSGRRRGLVVVLSVAAVLGLGGGGVWYFFLKPASLPSPRPAAATPMPPPPTTGATLPSAQPSVAFPVSSVPPSVVPPATTTPTPAPPSSLATQPPQARPTASATGVPGLSEARSLLQSGNYDQAGRGFLAHLKASPPGTSTIQILVACSPETVQKASAAVGAPDLFIVPVSFKGRDCLRLCWGLYPDQGAAQNALRTLPAYFRENGANPRVTATREILP